jgi:hypothetical protein
MCFVLSKNHIRRNVLVLDDKELENAKFCYSDAPEMISKVQIGEMPVTSSLLKTFIQCTCL